ncbi:MAG: hypothetical protein RLZZ70_743 [Candidatus Parcubacteria bacterium]|jgi:O-antigen ligase/tetratricopeptide (TPR) repeat protein
MKDILQGLVIAGLFAVPFLTLYVENDFFFPFITGKNFAFRIIVEVVLALWVILACLDKTYRPRFSWILASFTGLIAAMGLATLTAEHVSTALWSNFERMDGYITLIHVYAYFVVLATMLRTPKIWSYFLHLSIVAAALVAFIGLGQLAGGSTGRVESKLGNAAYMAIYMLFHIFITAYLFAKTKVVPYRVIYGLLIALFVFVLFQTGTRGTAIGLATGSLAAVVYMAMFAVKHPNIRRYAVLGVVGLVIMFAGFYTVRDSAYVQNTPSLARIANIDLGNDLRIRSIIWNMSLEGIKERPVTGWGNGNFNYVFNEQYDPRLYAQEQWFDRVHNIFFDWLIAGGVLGLVAYFSIFASLAYYLLIKAWRGDETFSLVERGILFGLLVGYLTHNIVVFDNIISYIFFAVILALLHSRYSVEIPRLTKISIPTPLVSNIIAPAMIVLVVGVVYVLNVPNIQAARGLIVAFQTNDLDARLEKFEELLALPTFARQEITEQLAQQAMSIAQADATAVDPETKAAFLAAAEGALNTMVEEKPNDARLHVFFAGYYRSTGNSDKAREQLAIARSLSPNKQAIILQQGAVELAVGQNKESLDYFREAYELDTTNEEAREYYFAALYYNNERESAATLLSEATPTFLARLAMSDFVFSAINNAGDYETLARLYEERVTIAPTVAQSWASLAFAYHQLALAAGTNQERKKIFTDKAIDTLTRGAAAVPSFTPTAQCVTNNLKAGRAPETGCR